MLWDTILQKLDSLEKRMKLVEKITKSLGNGCKEAFNEVQTCINHLAETMQELNQDFSDNVGICDSRSFFN